MDGHETSDRLRQIEAAIAAIERRVSALEGSAAPHVPPSDDEQPIHADHHKEIAQRWRPNDVATLLGRGFLVLGGAYLLRAVTQSGRLPVGAGVVLGLVYAFVWLIAADRAAPSKRLSAAFHGVTAMLLALPIVWEAATTFHLLSGPAAALTLAAIAALAMIVASRRQSRSIAAACAFGVVAVAFAAGWAGDRYGAYALLLVALSAATFWYSEQPRHAWLRWPVAIAAGVMVMIVTARAASTPARESIAVARLAQALLIVTMQSCLAVRLVLLSRPARLFDIAQGFSAFAIGIGGAVIVAQGSGARIALIGVDAAVLGSGAYLAAFFRLADRPHLSASYHAFAAFGLVAVTTAVVLLFDDHTLAIVSLALALVALSLGQRRLDEYAALHASVFLVVSVIASDLLTTALGVWVSHPDPWPGMDLVAWITLAAATACAIIPVRPQDGAGRILTMTGRIAMASVVVIGAGGAALMLIAPAVAHDAGALASLRTVLLSLAVVGLTIAGRSHRLAIFSTLVYPALIIGGVRIVADDFRHSRAATLFVALAFYGAALVIAGRSRTAASQSARAGD
jgi:hypothetical protein